MHRVLYSYLKTKMELLCLLPNLYNILLTNYYRFDIIIIYLKLLYYLLIALIEAADFQFSSSSLLANRGVNAFK